MMDAIMSRREPIRRVDKGILMARALYKTDLSGGFRSWVPEPEICSAVKSTIKMTILVAAFLFTRFLLLFQLSDSQGQLIIFGLDMGFTPHVRSIRGCCIASDTSLWLRSTCRIVDPAIDNCYLALSGNIKRGNYDLGTTASY
ncbi:hypothetical protein H112_01807 [Trichophyton rubrum D6]|uniref:Uncharacterized protein n=3 Tax=Trichophyton TaxID=5550 RepID=F2SVK4_TRIRC|nr:uncharacterized protein TERG_06576 [Trichophyton rubrum CBS 118892]EZF26001.1 hypothetical protein H100_01803 [Trichophyton rubrum MR850]EZF44995.1 hypothetical protein H102_01798 [Trichophyton rubrum CBS 100081]EZF55650.1 hypothetical protein H103_01808 [Trichophyton rubrum CBS 288.86]EZF66314.1 hypothetical protein H104_01785 [Trichophyton rubrum CBS 289.86]EZF76862.1 hypothetical protein H105_01812 [Trichophyton soudanense CBS 452.61]EZF87632.1 hypothetical protein H110_01809 [Trichophy